MKEYSQLLEGYKTLRRAYEESSTVKNGVKAAVEEPRNPYALVLIDGNGYIVRPFLVVILSY